MIVQRIIMSVFLFIIYYFVFGLAVVLALLINRKLLKAKSSRSSSWVDAAGYDADMPDVEAQS